MKEEIDDLIQKLDQMLKEEENKEEIEEILKKLEELLKEYLKEN